MSDLESRVQTMVDRYVSRGQAHGIVAGIQSENGHIDAAAAAGFCDVDGSAEMTPDTPYHLASITKMYTATAVMKLAGSREIDLDSPISEYLGEDLVEGIHVIDGTDHGGSITVAQLLDQTSGLADYFDGTPKGGSSLADDLRQGRDRALTIGDVCAIVRLLSPEFAPGAGDGRRAHYSDTNYSLLGAIIEAVTGRNVAGTFKETIFEPLGLQHTYVFDHTLTQPAPAAMYFKARALDIPLAMSSFAPDGGVVSTLVESLRFLRALFGGELLTGDQLALMTQQWNPIFFPLEYGGGLMRFAVPRWMSPFKAPPGLIGHSGSTGSFAFHDPKRAIYVAGTFNQMENPGRPYRLMTRMIDLLD
ncbi:beta-lactamase family protein [bacterium]|nr:beta-lactamase family protein [bacterium]